VNDEFLANLELEVPQDLEGRIKMRIRELEGKGDNRRTRDWFHGQVLPRTSRHKALAIAMALILLAACAAGIVRIGGFVIAEGTEPPGEPPAGVEPVPQEIVARSEALEAAPFEVGLPEWVPEGYGPTDRAMVTLPSDGAPLSEAWQVWVYWETREGASILLVAFPSELYRGDALPFGPESAEEVDVEGLEGAAIRGNWGGDGTEWRESAGGNVLWVRGETAYWLQSTSVSLDDLVRMARSVR
jgi:hypothetical protein